MPTRFLGFICLVLFLSISCKKSDAPTNSSEDFTSTATFLAPTGVSANYNGRQHRIKMRGDTLVQTYGTFGTDGKPAMIKALSVQMSDTMGAAFILNENQKIEFVQLYGAEGLLEDVHHFEYGSGSVTHRIYKADWENKRFSEVFRRQISVNANDTWTPGASLRPYQDTTSDPFTPNARWNTLTQANFSTGLTGNIVTQMDAIGAKNGGMINLFKGAAGTDQYYLRMQSVAKYLIAAAIGYGVIQYLLFTSVGKAFIEPIIDPKTLQILQNAFGSELDHLNPYKDDPRYAQIANQLLRSKKWIGYAHITEFGCNSFQTLCYETFANSCGLEENWEKTIKVDLQFSGNNISTYVERQRRSRYYNPNNNCAVTDTGLQPHTDSDTNAYAFSPVGNEVVISPMTSGAEFLKVVTLNKNKFVLNVDGELYFFK